MFASCSDDHTVALWDVRHLRQRVHTLRGHTKPCGESVHQEHLFKLHGLMRMKLSPDLNKLVLCTSTGFMLLLQNLDLEHFYRDMANFSLKTGLNLRGCTTDERSVIGRSRNRPVIIEDFPKFNKAQIIHSMQIHPQSWAVLSRNTSASDESEFLMNTVALYFQWTCVHDIQEFPIHEGPSEDTPKSTKVSNTKAMGNLPSSPNRLAVDDMEEGEELPSRGYYIVGDEVTPRFEVLLDQRGGNWFDVPIVRQSAVRRDEPENEVEEDEEDETDEENDEQQPLQANAEENNRNAFEDDSDEFDIDDLVVENNRQRAIMMGLNILINRNAASVYGDLRAVGDGEGAEAEIRERRRRGMRIRPATQASSFRQRQLNRNRWRVTRRLSQLTRTYREQLALARLTATSINGAAIDGLNRQNNPPPRAPNPIDSRSWNERTDEIRQTLRSLRSGLDMVMANLNNVRQQIDDRVETGLNYSGLLPALREGIRTTPMFLERYRSPSATWRAIYAQQRPRLTHNILEPNVGAGFIKELCFSADGRLICSPFKQGIRLLAFDKNCAEMSHCVSSGEPEKLVVLSRIPACHRRSVVSTKFSPTHLMLVSGCLDGKIAWHHPIL
ncbi:hypothetical protein HAZT_HAZT009245 [Hyalella azteca]|uniref:Uncharacterized protein n=1 Tax=Hyalella azteca TaxID=294128 RepID=A0A6A0HAZ2_HYAAZ|nr:hypothetical protein HAZT_HAZT009245 [Hyalella azteca]